jgi:hypothetical protein
MCIAGLLQATTLSWFGHHQGYIAGQRAVMPPVLHVQLLRHLPGNNCHCNALYLAGSPFVGLHSAAPGAAAWVVCCAVHCSPLKP